MMFYGTSHLRQNFRDRIDCLTLGSAIVIPRGYFREVVNYINGGDMVSMVSDPVRRVSAVTRRSSHVVIMPSRSFPFMDHFYDHQNYRKVSGDRNVFIRDKMGL